MLTSLVRVQLAPPPAPGSLSVASVNRLDLHHLCTASARRWPAPSGSRGLYGEAVLPTSLGRAEALKRRGRDAHKVSWTSPCGRWPAELLALKITCERFTTNIGEESYRGPLSMSSALSGKQCTKRGL